MPTYIFKCPKCKQEIERDFPRRQKSLKTFCGRLNASVRARYVRTIRRSSR